MFWNRSLLIFTLLICACSSSSVTSINPAQSPKPLTLLISIDGFKPEYLQKEVAPNLFKLAQNGATTKGMLPVFPSVTFPNHFSMVTGLYPDHHGIVNNAMKDPQIAEPFRLSSKSAVSNPAWWTDAVPVWVSAQQQGLISSTLFWPGTEAKIKGIQPNDWLVYDKGLRPPARVELLLEWLSRPNPTRADFATLYFEDVDSMGHRFGPNSAEVRTAVQQIDTVIGALLQGLEKRNLLSVTTILIVSDHGMAEVTPARRIELKPLLNDFSRVSVEWQGPMAGINLNGDSQDAVVSALQKNPQMQCWPKQQIPRKYNYGSHRRIPDIICLANLGYTIVSSSSFLIPGQHGFDPAHPEMHGIFIAAGYRVKKTQLDYFENIEIYPLLCRLLKISPEKNDAKDILFEQIITR
jgi:predicted AlkP superfamily pyrophosphatase or phosphodiesterase